MVSIWFFIGISLLVNGALILGAGIYQLLNPPAETTIVLYNLHANVWWGALLFVVGLIYTVAARPGRSHSA
jgi:uncharacterized membrane protein HdeD (DUF308 family)